MAGEWIKVENHLHEKVEVAEADMERVRKYIERNQNIMKGKK